MGVGIKFNEQNLLDKNFGKVNFIKFGYLDYIQGDGNSWIDTLFSGYRNNWSDTPGIIPEDAPKIQIEFEPIIKITEGIVNAYENCLFGVNKTASNIYPFCRIYLDSSMKTVIEITGKGASGSSQINTNQRSIIEYGSTKSKLNDYDIADNTNGSNQYRINAYDSSIKLLGCTDDDGNWHNSIYKIYDFKAYIGESLAKHLRPYRKSDGTVCMIDELTKKFYYNQGSGVLTGR